MARLHVLEMQPTKSALWALGRRGICPLLTLNAWGNRLDTPRDLTFRETTRLAVGGLPLFQAMVPARHLTFNADGASLVITIGAVVAIAVVCGARFRSRNACSNALYPVLPVERLCGQTLLVQITRGRCDTCNVGTPSGCIDLADRMAIRQVLEAPRHGAAWLRTPFGWFATALPGFIAAHGLIPDTHGADPLPICAAIRGGSRQPPRRAAATRVHGCATGACRMPARHAQWRALVLVRRSGDRRSAGPPAPSCHAPPSARVRTDRRVDHQYLTAGPAAPRRAYAMTFDRIT